VTLPAAAAEPNTDQNFFRLQFQYTADQDTPDAGYFRTLFQIRDLFLFDTNDLQLELDFWSPFETTLALSKWGFFQYHLAIGVEFGYAIRTNVDAEYLEQNSLYLQTFAGNRFTGALFARYTFDTNVTAKLSSGVEFNQYRTNDQTPMGYVLPEDNHGFPIKAAFNARGDAGTDTSWVAMAESAYVNRSQARAYGLAGERQQFDEGAFGAIRGFLDYDSRWLTGLVGLSALGGSSRAVRVGAPLVQAGRYDDVLYGFPERALPISFGALQRASLRVNLFDGLVGPQIHSALLVAKEDGRSGAHVSHGWGAGLEIRLSIPYIGIYYLSGTYQQGHHDVERHYSFTTPTDYQVLGTLRTSQIW